MGKETASWVTQLDSDNPTGTDRIGQGDDHLRMIKLVLKNSFPSASTQPIIPNMASQANKVLTTNGTDSSWSNTLSLSTLSLSSTLTVSGDVAVDTDTFFVDASANTVGINTTTPTNELDVQNAGGGGHTVIRAKNNNTSGSLSSYLILENSVDTASNYIYFGDSSDNNAGQIEYNHSTNKFSINVNAAEKFSIASTGDTAITNNLSLGGVVTSVGDTRGVNGLDGFSAYMVTNVNSLSGDVTLKGNSPNNYDWTTGGRHYNDGGFSTSGSTKGEYTVPSTGAYFVTATISLSATNSWPGTVSWRSSVLVNGSDVSNGTNLTAAPYDSNYEACSTWSGVLNLASGEKITIATQGIDSGDNYNIIGAVFCVRKLL